MGTISGPLEEKAVSGEKFVQSHPSLSYADYIFSWISLKSYLYYVHQYAE